MYAVTVTTPTTVDITLERPARKWRIPQKMHTLDAMLGFYVLRGDTPGQRVKPALCADSVLHQTNFLPAHEVRASLYLEPLENGASYVIMPATFGAGMRGPFSLGVSTDCPCEFEELPETNAPARAGEASP